MSYYEDYIDSLRDIFGADEVTVQGNNITVDSKRYPIVDDVIILLDPTQFTPLVRERLSAAGEGGDVAGPFAEDIQFSFGEEWKTYDQILPEHEKEFEDYFDLVNLTNLHDKRVCDLGCGIGRWSHFLRGQCRELVLLDFSDAVFVARRNLEGANALFFMGDLTKLPFRRDFADLIFCLGVLHHIPINALASVRELKPYAPRLLIYLYYSLDNRKAHYRILLSIVTDLRLLLAKIRGKRARAVITWVLTIMIYLPLISLGWLLKPFGLASSVPLFDGYHDKGLKRIRQDVYDRFFTRIEQRFSQNQILTLHDTFSEVTISDRLAYWHFLCKR